MQATAPVQSAPAETSLPILPLSALSNVWCATLNANGRFAVAALASVSMCGGIALSAVLIFFSRTVVRIVFQHRAFAAADAQAVTLVQSASLLQLPFAVGLALLSRFVASARVNRILIPIAAASLALSVTLSLLLMRSLAVVGIAMANTLAQVAVFVILLIGVSRVRRQSEVLAC